MASISCPRRYLLRGCIAVLLLVASSAGCYRLKKYNRDDYVLHGGTQAAPYRVLFVEFDDQGVKYSAGQLDRTLRHLSADGAKIVVTFAHGWFHNAERDDTNLAFFGEVLGQVSALEVAVATQDHRPPREVVGVFLGWRGAAWRMPVAKYFTFWNRKETAHRIGEREATDALIRISRAAYGARDAESPNPTRLIMMGHSFGGGLVYSALSQLITKTLIAGDSEKLADAVLLLNPAFEAARWEPMVRIEAPGVPLPQIVAVTSKTDRATGWTFPFGRWFSTLIESTRDIENPVFGGVIRERKATNRTVGHFDPFITHDLRALDQDGACPQRPRAKVVDPDELSKHPGPKLAQTSKEMLCDIWHAYRRGQEPMHFGETCLAPRKGLRHQQMSVFNIAADRPVWDGHAFEQTDGRRKKVLSFLRLLVPFMAGGNLDEACAARRRATIAGVGDRSAPPMSDAGVAAGPVQDAGPGAEPPLEAPPPPDAPSTVQDLRFQF